MTVRFMGLYGVEHVRGGNMCYSTAAKNKRLYERYLIEYWSSGLIFRCPFIPMGQYELVKERRDRRLAARRHPMHMRNCEYGQQVLRLG